MPHMTERPTHAYHLLPGGDAARLERVPLEVIEDAFTEYPDTGWEPRLEWLYKVLHCSCLDTRNLPGFGRIFFDDESLLRDEPQVNPVGSMLYSTYYEAGAAGHPLCGRVLLVVDHTNAPEGEVDQFVRDRLKHALEAFVDHAAQRYTGTLAPAEALARARQFHKEGNPVRAAGFFAIAAERAVHPDTEAAAQRGIEGCAANFDEDLLADLDW